MNELLYAIDGIAILLGIALWLPVIGLLNYKKSETCGNIRWLLFIAVAMSACYVWLIARCLL